MSKSTFLEHFLPSRRLFYQTLMLQKAFLWLKAIDVLHESKNKKVGVRQTCYTGAEKSKSGEQSLIVSLVHCLISLYSDNSCVEGGHCSCLALKWRVGEFSRCYEGAAMSCCNL